MKINPLLVTSAVIYGIAGLALTFAPQEVMNASQSAPSGAGSWIAQLLGAALLGLASLNWMQRYAIVGGVLGRPVLMTNLLFLGVSFWATLDAWRHHTVSGAPVMAILLAALATPFGLRFFAARASSSSA